MALGKVEQGTVRPNTKCLVQPIGSKCTIVSVLINDEPVSYASCGENISMRVNGISEDDLKKGHVICPIVDPVRAVTKFKAKIQVLELSEERPVLTAGYKAVIHCHVAIEECEIFKLYECTDPKTRKHKSLQILYEKAWRSCVPSLWHGRLLWMPSREPSSWVVLPFAMKAEQ